MVDMAPSIDIIHHKLVIYFHDQPFCKGWSGPHSTNFFKSLESLLYQSKKKSFEVTYLLTLQNKEENKIFKTILMLDIQACKENMCVEL
jgi:hypothetical protein